MMSQWAFLGSPLIPVREASMFVLNNVGYGPAIKSPSKRVESAGHDLILIVGMLSLQIIIIIRCLLMILCRYTDSKIYGIV